MRTGLVLLQSARYFHGRKEGSEEEHEDSKQEVSEQEVCKQEDREQEDGKQEGAGQESCIVEEERDGAQSDGKDGVKDGREGRLEELSQVELEEGCEQVRREEEQRRP